MAGYKHEANTTAQVPTLARVLDVAPPYHPQQCTKLFIHTWIENSYGMKSLHASALNVITQPQQLPVS